MLFYQLFLSCCKFILVVKMVFYYAVHNGRKTGVFHNWTECEKQTKGYKGARYKKFSTISEAETFAKYGQLSTSNESNCMSIDVRNTSMQVKSCKEKSKHFSENENSIFRKRKLEPLDQKFESEIKKTKHSVLVSEAVVAQSCKSVQVVYTDGACSKNGQVGCKAGYGVWWGHDHPLNLSCKLTGIQTNQRAEIAAVNAAIQQAKQHGIDRLLIKTDSMYVINCITKWVGGWKKRNWIKADGKPVIHKEEFLEMLNNMQHVLVEFEHVCGHSGIIGNEMADSLAVKGIQS